MNYLTQDITDGRLLVMLFLASLFGCGLMALVMQLAGWRPPVRRGKGRLKLPCHAWLALLPMAAVEGEWEQTVWRVAVLFGTAFAGAGWLAWWMRRWERRQGYGAARWGGRGGEVGHGAECPYQDGRGEDPL